MKATYERAVVAECPSDGATIIYDLRVETDGHWFEVETLNRSIAAATKRPLFQEDLTQRIVSELQKRAVTTCVVTTVGLHSGVKITAVAVAKGAAK